MYMSWHVYQPAQSGSSNLLHPYLPHRLMVTTVGVSFHCGAVTFVAIGNGAPDLSANISAIRNGQVLLSAGALTGVLLLPKQRLREHGTEHLKRSKCFHVASQNTTSWARCPCSVALCIAIIAHSLLPSWSRGLIQRYINETLMTHTARL